MATEGGDKSSRGGSVGGIDGEGGSLKLFVGQVPKHMTEAQLLAVFKDVALVDEVSIIKDKITKASRGCCFLICPSKQEADKVINSCHNKRTVPGASSPLQVKYADGEMEKLEHKLFVGMLPKSVTDAEVTALFSKFGVIRDLQLLRGSQTSKGNCAFLKYDSKEQALAALESLNGKHKMEGSNLPLVVKWADTEKERQARRAQKSQFQKSSVCQINSIQQPSLYGALPIGYMPPYNGFGYQAPETYGLMQYPLPSLQNQTGFHNMVSPVTQGNELPGTTHHPSTGSSFMAMQSAGYAGSGYPGVHRIQYPFAYHGSMLNPTPLGDSCSPVQPLNVNNSIASASSTSTTSGGQIEGPPGANLFIYHIPREYGDQELSNAFQGFGTVLSAKVFVDKATGVSKCFGFVSYDSAAAAQAAINVMNGFQIGAKKLKVQIKRENKQSKTY